MMCEDNKNIRIGRSVEAREEKMEIVAKTEERKRGRPKKYKGFWNFVKEFDFIGLTETWVKGKR